MASADELLNRALREVLQGDYAPGQGEVEISNTTVEQDQHFETCPDVTIRAAQPVSSSCGNDTCNITRITMTIGCPHQESADATWADYGSWPGLMDRMYEIGRKAIENDAYAREEGDG